jgi:hypothetical protein
MCDVQSLFVEERRILRHRENRGRQSDVVMDARKADWESPNSRHSLVLLYLCFLCASVFQILVFPKFKLIRRQSGLIHF